MNSKVKIFTIGHSNHPLEKFIRLLEDNGVMTLVDVRSTPYSRYATQFNKESLDHLLQQHEIQYVFAGKYLGGRPTDPSVYKNRILREVDVDYLHEVNYPEVMKKEWFTKAIDRLLEIANEQTSAIMCSEEDPANCHRHHLIAKYLIDQFPEIEVLHIRGDGTVYNAQSIRASVDNPPSEQLSFF